MAVTVPIPRADLRRALRKWRDRLDRFARPAKAPLRNLLSAPLFALGVIAFDVGVFQWSHRVGWMVTGLSLWLLEHVIDDEE